MASRKPSSESARATLADVKKEMSHSRVAKSAKEKYANLGRQNKQSRLDGKK
jgi:hypothetical protein